MTRDADNRTTELESLSKLKRAGKLRYWRGTIEIPETELHAICDEIQAEYDNAVHALNKAAGNWAKADAELREKEGDMTNNRTTELCKALDFMRIWISNDAHLGESKFSYELEKAEGLRKLEAIEQVIAATLGNGMLTAEQVRDAWMSNLNPPIPDWQAIADELNAELGNGTCKLIDTTIPSNDDYWNSAMCSECGADFTCAIFGRDGRLPDANYCPNCGRMVEHD